MRSLPTSARIEARGLEEKRMKRPLTPKSFIKQAEAIKNQIAAKRDELRGLMDEYEDIIEVSDRAVEGLECAIEALSEQV
jgi:hypothetical protein